MSSLMNPAMMYIVKSLSIKYKERIRGNVTVTKWIKIVLTALKNTFPSPSALSAHTQPTSISHACIIILSK